MATALFFFNRSDPIDAATLSIITIVMGSLPPASATMGAAIVLNLPIVFAKAMQRPKNLGSKNWNGAKYKNANATVMPNLSSRTRYGIAYVN